MKFIGGDFSNIEGRINAWLAGEQWKIDAFKLYDLGVGPDVYNSSFERAFGRPVQDKSDRQLGKIQELALGYQGGVGAYLKFVQTYQMRIELLIEPVRLITPPSIWESTLRDYNSATDKNNLLEEQWAAIKIIVRNWREAHPATKQSWYDLEAAGVEAVTNPDVVISVYNGRVRYLSNRNFLFCQSPSGHVISYPQPYMRVVETEYVRIGEMWINTDEYLAHEIELFRDLGFPFKKRKKNVVWFWGMELETKRWRTTYLYGGHQCENIVQFVAGCILKGAMKKVRAAGYSIRLHSHDEILALCKDEFGNKMKFEQLMQIDEPWLAGLPLVAKAWEDKRYMK